MGRHWLAIGVTVAAMLQPLAGADAAAEGMSEKDIYQLGTCIVRKDRSVAARLAEDLPVTPVETVVHSAALGKASTCLSVPSLSVKSTRMRGALAQALLLRDFPYFGVEPKISQRLFARIDLPMEPMGDVDARTAALYKLADCVVRNRAIETERLFRSGVGSDTENRIVDSFTPTMAACRGGQAPLSVNRADLRSLLAQAAYNVSVRYWSGQLWTAAAQ